MCSVYKSALLNIAADDAFDARGGCFRKRATSMVRPLEFYMPGLDESWYATIDERNMFDWMRRAPLSTRAWVLQERQLARRILHFTGQELVWECCAGGQYFASETFPSGAPLKRIFDGKPKIQAQGITTKLEQSTDGLYRQWDSLCVAYSELLLSHQSDKLLALSGLAKEFQTFLPEDTYVAGLWRNTLPRSLQWTAGRNSLLGPPRRRPNVAPSWSWASIEGPIKAAELPRDRKHREVSKIVRIHVEPEFGDPTGRIREAHMDICGFLRLVTIEDNHKENGTFPQLLIPEENFAFMTEDRLSRIARLELTDSHTLSTLGASKRSWRATFCLSTFACVTAIRPTALVVYSWKSRRLPTPTNDSVHSRFVAQIP